MKSCHKASVGRSYLFKLLDSQLQSDLVLRFADGPDNRRAFAQLEALGTELRETGTVYKCYRGSTMISPSRGPCWQGRPGIRI